jgi:hypothetical protein
LYRIELRWMTDSVTDESNQSYLSNRYCSATLNFDEKAGGGNLKKDLVPSLGSLVVHALLLTEASTESVLRCVQ